MVQGKEQLCDLGVCVPKENGMGVTAKIPVKRFPQPPVSFFLTGKQVSQRHKTFIPIKAGEPFSGLQMLERAYLGYDDGNVGAYIQD